MKKTVIKNAESAGTFFYAAPEIFIKPYIYIKYGYESPKTHERKSARRRATKIYNSFSNKVDAMRAVRAERNELELKLKEGWTPEGYHNMKETLVTLIEDYISYINRKLRLVTAVNYINVLHRFSNYLKSHQLGNVQPSDFTARNAIDYSNYMQSMRIKDNTYNFYLSVLNNLFKWIISRRLYDINNPWNYYKENNSHQTKDRVAIPHDLDEEILMYFRNHNPVMELIIQMIYQLYIRPSELLQLHCNDINIVTKRIIVPANISKTHRQRFYTLSYNIINLLVKFGYTKSDNLLFGFTAESARKYDGCQLKVGKKAERPCGIRQLDYIWKLMRNRLHISSCYKIYSYRDSGVQDLANSGLPNEVIKMLTGHISVDTINVYENHKADETRRMLLAQFVHPIGNRDNKADAANNLEKIIKENLLK